jgi:hypothetical protein
LINAWHIFRIIMYICIFNIGFLKKRGPPHRHLPHCYCRWRSSYQREIVITYLRLSRARYWIVNTICGGLFFVQSSKVVYRYVDIGTHVGQYCLNFRCIREIQVIITLNGRQYYYLIEVC